MSDERQKVYIVTSGTYSGYSIDGVFLDEDEAESFAKKLRMHSSIYDDASVETWTVGGDFAPDGMAYYTLHIWDDEIKVAEKTQRSTYIDGEIGVPSLQYIRRGRSVGPGHTVVSLEPERYLRLTVLAQDEEHAIKIGGEKKAEWLAHEAGID